MTDRFSPLAISVQSFSAEKINVSVRIQVHQSHANHVRVKTEKASCHGRGAECFGERIKGDYVFLCQMLASSDAYKNSHQG